MYSSDQCTEILYLEDGTVLIVHQRMGCKSNILGPQARVAESRD